MPVPESTTSDLARGAAGPWARWTTRLGVVFLFLIVVAGAVGVLGPRQGEVSAAADGYALRVTYPSVTRAGQPAPLHVYVTRAGGFTGPVQVSLCDAFFTDLDFQNWYPGPSAETAQPGRIIYEFDPPSGETLEITLDARVAPGQFGQVQSCGVAVLVQGQPAVRTSFTSWRMP